jgi:hypothetical protein
MRYLEVLAISAVVVASGCSVLGGDFSGSTQSSGTWLRDGSIAVSRPVPSHTASNGQTNDPLLGFMPTKQMAEPTRQGTWLRITRSSRKIEVVQDGRTTSVISGDGVQALRPGTYTIAHKQETPLWYAPDQYFALRDIEVPTNNETERFRRGALGTAAVFLDADTPIHNGPVWRDEIGGVRIDDQAMSALFNTLKVGDAVEVR